MGLADEFERRLEKMVEGVFSKAFRSDVEPAEIGRRLLREMEGGKSVSMAAVYVPNSYLIRLASDDFERLEGLIPNLRSEFVGLLRDRARQRRWRPAGGLSVEFERDDRMAVGRFEIDVRHQEQPGDEGPPVLLLVDSTPQQAWKLETERLIIGRSPDAEIVLSDPNVSRAHAEVVRREGEWWVVDLGSTNGTLVNESMVKERRLAPGDTIRLGSSLLEFAEEPLGEEA
ncbi:MAG: FhaA domain-containing protein [Actinomycetota bacterium]